MQARNTVRATRLKLGLTIAEVGVRAECSPNTLSMIELNQHLPRLAVREKIARALGVDVTVLFPEA